MGTVTEEQPGSRRLLLAKGANALYNCATGALLAACDSTCGSRIPNRVFGTAPPYHSKEKLGMLDRPGAGAPFRYG